jgi:putative alpha-1,2-mannosidase
LYPVYGQTHYILVPPLFDSFEADLENGKTIRITADRSGGSKYISAAELNGKQLDRAWVRHEEIANGAELKFILSDKISDWGTKDRPRLT